jgi:hypothetical protein
MGKDSPDLVYLRVGKWNEEREMERWERGSAGGRRSERASDQQLQPILSRGPSDGLCDLT